MHFLVSELLLGRNYGKETVQIIQMKKKIVKERFAYHFIQIEQFQHERLVHLMVTIFIGTLTFLILLFGFLLEISWLLFGILRAKSEEKE